MPAISDRQRLIKQIDFFLKILAADGLEKSQEFQNFMELRFHLDCTRNINPICRIPKSSVMEQLLWDLPEREFKLFARCDKRSFVRLVSDLEGHQVFRNKSRHAQNQPWIQILITLNRLGCEGNGASIGALGVHWGKSFGSISNFTDRTIAAIVSKKDAEISWPSAEERKSISGRFDREHGLKGCVGVVDGTHVNFYQRPGVDGETFFNRKGRYSMNVQLVCDDKRRIIYYQLGWPGSCFDGTIFGKSRIVQHPELFFSSMEFLLGDAGFAATWFLLTPYRHPAAAVPHNQLYNTLISSPRQKIEHVNGILKGRFQSLKNVRILIRFKNDLNKFCRWILACLVLHNMLIHYQDSWDDKDDDENDDDDDVVNENLREYEDSTAFDLRISVQNYILNWYSNLRA